VKSLSLGEPINDSTYMLTKILKSQTLSLAKENRETKYRLEYVI
jgi:hypothetical protein